MVKGRYARFMTADSGLRKEWNSRLAAYGCRRCHRLGGEGNSLAADLDFSSRKKPPEELAAAIRRPVQAMPDFSFADVTIDETVTALLAAATGSRQTANRQLVHFEPAGGKTEDSFSRKCGGCHRALTARNGSLGRGNTAPNLSGLFSPSYPGSSAKGERWNRERLEKWLRNPRKIRQNAGMQPVEVTGAELREITKILEYLP